MRRLWQDVWVSEDSGYPGAPPGWYADPAGGPGQRWWDGYAWSEATVLPDRPPPPPWAGAGTPPGPPSQVAPGAVASQRLSTLTTRSLVDGELGIAAGGPFRRRDAGCLLPRQPDHATRQRRPTALRRAPVPRDLARHPEPHHATDVPRPQRCTARSRSSSGWLRWPVSSSRASGNTGPLRPPGRSGSLPAAPPPGAWASWFVPVVNLWMPYSAVRDCLPHDDPHRPRVLHWWIAWLVAAYGTAAAGVCALVFLGQRSGRGHPGRLGLPRRPRLGARHRHGYCRFTPAASGKPGADGQDVAGLRERGMGQTPDDRLLLRIP